MAVLRILLMVEDSPSVVVSAVTMSSAPTAAPDLPVGFVLDPSFPAVPIERPAVQQTLFAMSAGIGAGKVNNIGPRAYLVRGLIDEALLDQAIRQTTQADGATRIFADPEISAMPTCGGTPPVGTALDVKRLLGAGRLVQEKMDGRDVALAIVDTGINLSYLQAKGLQPSLDVHASWTSSAAIIPGQGVVDHGTMCAYDALLTAPNALLFDYAVLSGTTTGGSIMSGVLSNAVSAYGKLLQLMTLSPDERHFHSMVVSNSWGVFKQSWDFPPGTLGAT